MKNNEQINTVSNNRYLVIMHGENVATFVDTPFTSSKMDIYHQLRNLRVKAAKVNQVVLHEFYDIPEEVSQSLKNAYESRLWTIDDREGKHWDALYKELLLELEGYRVKKEPKQKKAKNIEQPDTATAPETITPEVTNPTPEPTNILPGGDVAINDPEEPEMVTVPLDGAETAIPANKTTNPIKKDVKKDTKKGKK